MAGSGAISAGLAARSRTRTTLALCAAAALFEGFDNQSMGVAAPRLFREFAIAPAQGGIIFSAATLGLFIGAVVGGRAADHLGRRQTLVLSLLLFGACSLLTSIVDDAPMLIGARLLTGLGLGGAMPNFIAMAAEAVEQKRRLRALTLVMAALPLGGALAGVMALVDRLGFGWRSIFIVGGVAPIALALTIAWLLRTPQAAIPTAPSAPRASAAPIARFGEVLWRGGRARTTLLLWTGFFFTQIVLFLMLNWLPNLIVGLGFSRSEASVASIVFNLAGALGAATLGRQHAGASRGLWVVITYGGVTLAVAGLAAVAAIGKTFSLVMLACLFAGIFIISAQLVLFALAPLYYPTAMRGTGVGAAVSVGRLGSIVGPLFAASLLASGGGSVTVLAAILPFVLIAGGAAFALTWRPQSGD